MIKPFTCLCMLAAAGSLMYLYQAKHAAQVMDREIAGLIKTADQTRERTGLLRAEYAMLNDPERLAQLASAHLQLTPLAPAQFARLADLGSRLPGPVAPLPEPAIADDELPPAPEPAPLVAALTTPLPRPIPVQVATSTAAPPPPAPYAAGPTLSAPTPSVTVAIARPAKPHDKPVVAAVLMVRPMPPEPSHIYASIQPAFTSPARLLSRPPMVQRTGMGSAAEAPVPFVGSALGMARTPLAAPVPFSSATELGSASGR